MCNGNSYTEQEFVVGGGKLSPAAFALREQEESSFLTNVTYDVFWGKVKLVGYTMKLRPDHMRMIEDDINI